MICQSSSFLAAGFVGWDCFWARRTSSSIIRIALEVCWHWTITNWLSSRKRQDPICGNGLKGALKRLTGYGLCDELVPDLNAIFLVRQQFFRRDWKHFRRPVESCVVIGWSDSSQNGDEFSRGRRYQFFNEEQTTVWNPVDKSNWNEDEYRKKERKKERQTDRQTDR